MAYTGDTTRCIKPCVKKPRDIDISIAQAIEITSCSPPDHALVVVRWLYRPEEIPEGTRWKSNSLPVRGRQPCHGCNEVILSDHCRTTDLIGIVKTLNMDIDDIMPVRAIHGLAGVKDMTTAGTLPNSANVYHYRQFYRHLDKILIVSGFVMS